MPMLGDRVLAQWPVEEVWWYPGTVVGVDGMAVEVQYDDGDRASLEPNQVRTLSVSIGARVNCRWQGGATYYGGKVAEVVGHAVYVSYDDGDQEWTTIGMMRINQNDL